MRALQHGLAAFIYSYRLNPKISQRRTNIVMHPFYCLPMLTDDKPNHRTFIQIRQTI